MKEAILRLEDLLNSGKKYVSETAEEELSLKTNPEKWSKKEILGHLIDSAINNLQRFTEIQFSPKPFKIKRYNQNELVISNNYQHASTFEILSFWLALNTRIIEIMKMQTPETLLYKIEVGEGEILDLRFLMVDYVDHLEHHLKQILA